MMLWHPTNVQQIHRTEMTLQAIMDHLHLGIAHVRRCSAHCVDHALQCLQTHQDDVLLRHDSRVPFEKPDREGHKHSGFNTLASQTLGAAALAERLLRQVTKSREFFCWVLFVVESVEEKERGAQSNDALLNQSFTAGHTELKQVTLEHSPPDPAEKTCGEFPRNHVCKMSIVKEFTLVCSPVSSNGDRCRVAVSSERRQKHTRTGRASVGCSWSNYLEDPSKAQACHVSPKPNAGMSASRARPRCPEFCLRHTRCATTFACWAALCSVIHRSHRRQAVS